VGKTGIERMLNADLGKRSGREWGDIRIDISKQTVSAPNAVGLF
jgi:hypothetical protein